MKRVKYILWIAAIAAIGIGTYLAYRHFSTPEEVTVMPGRPGNIEEMARLCSMEIYNEVPVRDTVNSKMIFAIQKQTGSISFDMEHLQIDDSGDTVRIVLPREIVELRESTEKGAWQVIDTKAIGPMSMFRSDKLSIDEENRVKAKLKERSVKRLYSNGTVRKAREDAKANLARLMEAVYRRPVIVTDPTPKGSLK